MSTLFDNYDREYHDLVGDIKEKIENVRRSHGTARSDEVKACERDIQDALEVLETMDLGVRSVADPTQRGEMNMRVKEYRRELDDLKSEMNLAEASLSDRDQLFSDASSDLMVTGHDQRDEMLRTNDLMKKDSESLRNAASLAAGSVDTLVDVSAELSEQGDRMEGMLDRFSGINDSISSVRKTLGDMSRRNITTKIIIAAIIVLLIATIITLLYVKFGM
mmetsp:Transcript_32763/g.91765  ORF Transcript_32763/g.91765 Transcript_32763/m.91765 type:complete len:220 (+) Transcript_32763:45-704(+)